MQESAAYNNLADSAVAQVVRCHFNAFMRRAADFARYPRRLANCIHELEAAKLTVPSELHEARDIATSNGYVVKPHGNVEKFPDRRRALLQLAVWMAWVEIENGMPIKKAIGKASDWVNSDPKPLPSLEERMRDENYDPDDPIVIEDCLVLADLFGSKSTVCKPISENVVRRAYYAAKSHIDESYFPDPTTGRVTMSSMLSMMANLRPKEAGKQR